MVSQLIYHYYEYEFHFQEQTQGYNKNRQLIIISYILVSVTYHSYKSFENLSDITAVG